ncbi:MAG: methyltransferase domain-containing protein [Acidimicrobiia bacterium]|nr:methyltransferase domain-containing protein [Acidimicrobiia bacterium]
MITVERIPEYYDWLSRYVQVANWLAYGDRYAACTMHKRLAAPEGAGRTAGVEYVNDHLLEVAGLPAGARVLDAGCGFGGTTFCWQAKAGGRYDGVTVSAVQAAVARRQARRRGVEDACRFHVRSYDDAFVDDYDAVVAIESLVHAPELARTVANLGGALRPGGALVVLDDMAVADLDERRPREADALRAHWGCVRYPTDADYRAALVGAGLAITHEEDLSPLMRPRNPEVLDRLERRYRRMHRLPSPAPLRTIVSAYLGGIALERLHGTGDVRYRLLVARPAMSPGPAAPAAAPARG